MSKNESPDWIDDLFASLESTSYDEETFESQSLPTMPELLFEDLFYRQNGSTKSIKKILDHLQTSYDVKSLPLDPSECFMLCTNLEQVIANTLGNVTGNIFHYENAKEGIVTFPDRNVIYNMWMEQELRKNGIYTVKQSFGRISAADNQHLIVIDRHYTTNSSPEFQLMLLQKSERDADFITSGLFIDLKTGFIPYNNVSIFGENADQIPHYKNASNIRSLCYSFVGNEPFGGLPSPEFV